MTMYAIKLLPNGATSWRAITSESDLLGGELFATNPPDPTLEEVRMTLCAQIDASADAAYIAIGGPSPGRLAEYKQAKADADAFKAAGYTGSVPDTIACWAEARAWTAEQACDDILITAASWEIALSVIRRQRLIGKANVNAASDAAAAQAAAAKAAEASRSAAGRSALSAGADRLTRSARAAVGLRPRVAHGRVGVLFDHAAEVLLHEKLRELLFGDHGRASAAADEIRCEPALVRAGWHALEAGDSLPIVVPLIR